MNSNGGQVKDSRLQWGEVPSSIGKAPVLFVFMRVCCMLSLELSGSIHPKDWFVIIDATLE